MDWEEGQTCQCALGEVQTGKDHAGFMLRGRSSMSSGLRGGPSWGGYLGRVLNYVSGQDRSPGRPTDYGWEKGRLDFLAQCLCIP